MAVNLIMQPQQFLSLVSSCWLYYENSSDVGIQNFSAVTFRPLMVL
ncbi:hypothetical protein T11_11463 [Trichinella zimbabwensis]|uniref:Uncharacterized protein n=1 Tax=Trichinella zimbabwensis TaxID=268475 RepID=A0A0V1G8S1_9BILA|nr:hypothetical protein T11_11463 [Trichinella zimbabwensis]